MSVLNSALGGAACLAIFLSACGSSGGSAGALGGGTVSGRVVNGPVVGASVRAYAIAGGTMGAELGAGTTDPKGDFTVSLGGYLGPVMVQASGGSYADEATGTSMDMLPGDVLAACLPGVTAGSVTSGLQLTPLTSMAQARAAGMAGGMTAASIDSANAAVGSYFSVSDILFTAPMDPTVAGAGMGATQEMKNYGMSLAAMSEYARSIGMASSSSGIVTAMMDDASDGIMDGKMGSMAISMAGMGGMMGGGIMQAKAGTSGLATAMSSFLGSGMNRSGVQASDMQLLMDELTSSGGVLP